MSRIPGIRLPGGFRADWSVWCAAQIADDLESSDRCPQWASVEGRHHKTRAKNARRIGWTFVSGVGWLCPDCYELWKERR